MGGNLYPGEPEKPVAPTEETKVTKTTVTIETETKSVEVPVEEKHSGPTHDEGAE